jgi:hypothetical protein
MKENYELLIDDKLWISYPKSRGGLESAIAELDECLSRGDDPVRYRIVYSRYNAIGLTQRYDVFDVEWGDVEDNGYTQSMDGDFDSGMASAGLGTDEDYGHFGGEDY